MSRIKTLKTKGRYRSSASPFALRFKIILLVFALFGIVIGWAWYAGHITRTANAIQDSIYKTGADYGLIVENIVIEGHKRTSQEAIFEILQVGVGDPFLKFDPGSSYQKLSALPWVKKVHVERHWPNTLKIVLDERTPIALWQHKKVLHVIDETGIPIPHINIDDHKDLPLVMGEGAPKAAKELQEDLISYPDFSKEILACVRIGNRRWNLKLKNGIVLMLPESGQKQALDTFIKLEKSHQLMAKAKTKIDWRIKNKVIIS